MLFTFPPHLEEMWSLSSIPAKSIGWFCNGPEGM
jgi:hypothetical protein